MGSHIIYDSKEIIEQALNRLELLPSYLFYIHGQTKEIQNELRELENCGYEPDQRLREEVHDWVNKVYNLKKIVLDLERLQSELVEKCGWSVDYDETLDIYIVSGPCFDDYSEIAAQDEDDDENK